MDSIEGVRCGIQALDVKMTKADFTDWMSFLPSILT